MNVTHPTWCDLARCEAAQAHNGAHTSYPTVILPDEISTARLQVRVWRRGDGPTYVELTVGDHAHGHRIRADLSLGQAYNLWNALRAAISRRPLETGES